MQYIKHTSDTSQIFWIQQNILQYVLVSKIECLQIEFFLNSIEQMKSIKPIRQPVLL